MNPVPSEEEVIAEILDVIRELESRGDAVDISLGNPLFDRVPCSKPRLYRVARSHCYKWNYEYQEEIRRASRSSCRRLIDSFPTVAGTDPSKPALIKIKGLSDTTKDKV